MTKMGGYVVVKMMFVGLVAYRVIANSDLSALERSLIVAGVSGILGILGIALGSYLSGRWSREVLEVAAQNHELAEKNAVLLKELKDEQKKASGSLKRIEDEASEGE